MYQYNISFHDTMHTTKPTGTEIGNISNHLYFLHTGHFPIQQNMKNSESSLRCSIKLQIHLPQDLW